MNKTLEFGEGLFETINWQGENEKFQLHYERLKRSAQDLSLPYPSYEEFLRVVETASGGEKNIYIKVILTYRGQDHYSATPDSYEIRVKKKPLPKPPENVKLGVSPFKRHSQNPLWRYKTTNYFFGVMVKRHALSQGRFDDIVLNELEYVTECSASNLIVLKDGKLLTPHRDSGLLVGTTLTYLSRKFPVEEKHLKVEDLLEADSLFITNSIMGVVPVEEVAEVKKRIDNSLLQALREVL